MLYGDTFKCHETTDRTSFSDHPIGYLIKCN